MFGDRFPWNYKKIWLLGKGGCAVVWEGEHFESKERVAIK